MKNYLEHIWPKIKMCSWLMGHVHDGGKKISNWNPETWTLLKNPENA